MTLPQTRDTTRKISSLTSTVRTGEHCLEQAGDWGMSSNREAAPGWAGRDQASREALVVWEEQAGWSPHTESWLPRLSPRLQSQEERKPRG